MNSAFKALADPTRRTILALLKEKDMSAGDIAAHFDISGASISHHLKELHNAGLVLKERQGQHIYYSINTTVLQEVFGWFLQLSEKDS